MHRFRINSVRSDWTYVKDGLRFNSIKGDNIFDEYFNGGFRMTNKSSIYTYDGGNYVPIYLELRGLMKI